MPSEDGYSTGWAERAVTDAAFALANGRHELQYNGARDSVWRVRPDAVVELARRNLGRVELLEVFGDGGSQRVAASPRSLRRILATLSGYATGAALVVGVAGGMVSGHHIFFVLAASSFFLFPLGFLLRWRSPVRPWVRERFGTDRDWANVPYRIEGEPRTGNQVVALCALAGTSDLRYRVVEDGTLEAVIRRKQVEVHAIDRYGSTSLVETRPKRGFELAELRGPDVTWHDVIVREPGD